MSGKQRLLVSILSLGRPANVLRQLTDLPAWLEELAVQVGIASHIVVRNNDPASSFAEVAERVAEVNAMFADVTCTLVTDVPNNGFGAGHNSNIASAQSDFVLILNDDIGFPHMAWLAEALSMLEHDEAMAAVAAEENPRFVNPLFGNGVLPGSFHVQGLTYGEASILLCRRSALAAAGGFHADFAWAMCEDADLSLRLQQLGYTVGFIAMPHQHWRSTSFNSLPGPVKASILEHNRAALFANWRDSFAAGRVGRYEVFDLWSDGMGDVLCALPHVLARIEPMTAAQRANVLVNTSHPELFSWLDVPGIRVQSEPDIMKLRNALAADGIATLRSTRETNFSLPFNIHTLLAGALGVAPAGGGMRTRLAACLARLRPPPRMPQAPGNMAVLHLEFDRTHEGRALPPAMISRLLTLCGQVFDTVVLVGRERRLSPALADASTAHFVDLQGKLSLTQLAAVIARAGFFVGIDSFPAHLAQACGVPAALFFGAVHPLTRTWQAARVWPLTAALDCIGCYHTHLEVSVPFCMRRDQACTTELQDDAMRGVLQQMVAGTLYDWSEAELSLQALQSRLIKLAKFHPAPPERVFRGIAAPNERVSNLIYQMADQMGELLRGQYQTSTVNALLGQVQELQSQVFTGRVLLDEARRSLSQGRPDQPARAQDTETTRILQLSRLALEQVRCRIAVADQWIDVDSFDDDPQLLLPVIRGSGGKVQLRLSCIAESYEALQIYWALGDEPFSIENLRTVPADSSVVSVNLVLDVAEGDLLRIRVDPITGIGACRLHGSLGGMFALVEQDAVRAREGARPVKVAQPAAASAKAGGEGAKRSSEAGAVRPAARTTRRSALR
jgi:GT2 family glycosyltransferase